MSTFYDTEPQPTASLVLHTTSGEIAIELFAKQTPLTSRNFLQHCLDGYYDNTIFHRLVPGFIVQGGDPTGTGNGGESIFDGGALSGDLDVWPMDERRGANAGPHGIGFKDEFHTRLKFNRRGLLGMANEGKPDTNGSQFFFTLDKTDELNGKNTVFGRVAGPTIYNLTKIGQGDVQEGSERPLYPTRITRTEILTNPFSDMRKTERDARHSAVSAPRGTDEKKKTKRKKGVNKNLLSFGDDVEDDLEGDSAASSRGKSKRAKLDKDDEDEAEDKDAKLERTESTHHHKTTLPSRTLSGKSSPERLTKSSKRGKDKHVSDSETDPDSAPRRKQPEMTALEKTNAEIAALKASMRRTVAVEPENTKEDKKSALDSLIPSDARRGKKFDRKNGLSSHDKKTLRSLDEFTSKLGQEANGKAALPPPEQSATAGPDVGEGEGDGTVCDLHFIANCQSCRPWDKNGEDGQVSDSDGEDWMSHTLNCAADKLGKDLSYRKKAEEELIVIDPREKAHALKEERSSSRRDSGRAGGHRDQTRHAKLSQAATVSGRGAR
ncbi:peptidyl-prolyl cis-trans isomerase SDCCAG10 [Sporothrix brasiliensis 5110]|uniref:peptidylprolyl isomerase n=1 Tax=Sporothrix brasiliensis 5110 TaxID=1398154 RepID=A0A0C2EXE5_9PEZI|nr:peptidyl-prolyl cis-trans isomerase SDCCAG10 [Sporothrix brasiliensis 5110]KIH91269.1 peptidyl-prolyl cis-trans isomerase SDCCAG10 [Sporothrix brasiliensis 5110]